MKRGVLLQKILDEAYEYASQYLDEGEVASYIPELAKEDKYNLAGVIIDKDKNIYEAGVSDYKFSMQSISKVATYLCAIENLGYDKLKNHVGVKPSSKPFNSLIELELSDKNIPVNPFINAGAIVCTSLLFEKYGEKTFDIILDKLKKMSANDDMKESEMIFKSENATSHANRALTYIMVYKGIISKDISVEDMLQVYFKCCSILSSTKDLAMMSFTLSNDGMNIKGEQVVEKRKVRLIRTLMATCGTYDYSGDFAIKVGVPAKSGVGGGIMLASKHKMGIAAYSPGLDSHGNSLASMRLLSFISNRLSLDIY